MYIRLLLFYKKINSKKNNFFELFETICKNWQYFWDLYTPNKKQKWFSIDVAAAIACKILNLTNDNNFEFRPHENQLSQDWQEIPKMDPNLVIVMIKFIQRQFPCKRIVSIM